MSRPKSILRVVAAARSLSVADLVGEDRARPIAWPRQEACWLMRQRTALSLGAIGRIMGGRDHSTIVAALAAVEKRMAESQDYQDEVARMAARLDTLQLDPATEPVADIAVRAIRQAGDVSKSEALRLAAGILTVSTILQNRALNDREGRQAARSVLDDGRTPAHA